MWYFFWKLFQSAFSSGILRYGWWMYDLHFASEDVVLPPDVKSIVVLAISLFVLDFIFSAFPCVRWIRLLDMLFSASIAILLCTTFWGWFGKKPVHEDVMFFLITLLCSVTGIVNDKDLTTYEPNLSDAKNNRISISTIINIIGKIIIGVMSASIPFQSFKLHQAGFTGQECCYWIAIPVGIAFYLNILSSYITSQVFNKGDKVQDKVQAPHDAED